jgi:hypothetical protein
MSKIRYVCWDAENDEDPGEAPRADSVVEDWNVEWAAEEFAGRIHDDSDYPDDMTIAVRDPSGAVHTVDILVEYEPSFSGSVRT